MKTRRRLGGVVGGVALALLAIEPAFAQGAAPKDPKAAAKPADPKAAAKPADPKAAAKPADPKAADPRAKYNAAVKKYDGGDYAGALADFQELDAIKATPQSTRYIALSQDKLAHYAEAVAAYEKFIASPGKMTKESEEATKRVEEIKKMPGKLHVETTPPGATITVDGKPSGTTPADVELPSGKHVVHVELAGYLPLDRDVELGYAAKQDVKAELEAKPAEPPPPVAVAPPPDDKPQPPPPPPQTPKSKLPAFITGGIAVAALGVGIGFGAAALSKQSEFNTNPTASTADEGENFALVADMMFGVAITLGVASAVLFFTKDDDAAAPAKAHIVPKPQARRSPITVTPMPYVTPHGGGAGALVRF